MPAHPADARAATSARRARAGIQSGLPHLPTSDVVYSTIKQDRTPGTAIPRGASRGGVTSRGAATRSPSLSRARTNVTRAAVPPCACRPRLCAWLPVDDPRARRADRLCRRGRALLDAQLAAEAVLVGTPRDDRGWGARERAYSAWEDARSAVQRHLRRAAS